MAMENDDYQRVVRAASVLFTNGHRPTYDDGVVDMLAAILGMRREELPQARPVLRVMLREYQQNSQPGVDRAFSMLTDVINGVVKARRGERPTQKEPDHELA